MTLGVDIGQRATQGEPEPQDDRQLTLVKGPCCRASWRCSTLSPVAAFAYVKETNAWES